jgi:outer membrane protein assembly factor BamB
VRRPITTSNSSPKPSVTRLCVRLLAVVACTCGVILALSPSAGAQPAKCTAPVCGGVGPATPKLQPQTRAPAPKTVPAASPTTDWLTYGFDSARTGLNPLETQLSPATAGNLKEVWSNDLGAVIDTQPVVATGVSTGGGSRTVAYAGSEHGDFYAVDASSGNVLWKQRVGGFVQTGCRYTPDSAFGVSGTPVIDKASNTIYLAGGDGQLYALDMSTGQIKTGWPVRITSAPGQEHVWGALTLSGGRLYAPIASTGCDVAPYNGRVNAVDVSTRSQLPPFYVVPPSSGRSGGGIWGWGGASTDSGGNHYVATGNVLPNGPGEHDFFAEQVVGLNSQLGVLAHNYPGLTGPDVDFGATPMIYQPPGCPVQAAVPNKSGAFFVYNVGSIQNGPLQRMQIANINDDKFIGVPAYSPQQNMVYVSNSSDSSNGTTKHGMVALKVQPNCTLTPAWQQNVGPNPVAPSPPTVANGVVYYGDGWGNQTFAFDATTGQQLWNSGSRIGGPIYDAPSVANGQLFVPGWDHKLHSFDSTGRPFVGNSGAGAITNNSANLSGTLNPNGLPTTYHFEYGTSPAYGSQTSDQSAGSGTTDQQVSASLPSLAPHTTYHLRLVATNAGGTTQGQDRTFNTDSPGSSVASSNQFGLPNQTDAFRVGDDGSIQVNWVGAGGPWGGPLQIAPPGTAPANAHLAASNQFGLAQTDLFFVGNDGSLQVVWVSGGGTWAGPLKISPAGTAPAGAHVAASNQFGLPNQTDVFTVGSDGATRVSWVGSSGIWGGPRAITPAGTSPAGGGVAASNQFGLPNQTDVFSVGSDGATRVSWVPGGGAWGGPMPITPGGAFPPGAPLAASNQFGLGNQTDVFATGGDGGARVSWVAGGGAWGGPMPITPGGTFPAGTPIAASNQFGLPNQTDVFGVSGDGGSRVAWVVGGGRWGGPQQITPSGTAPSGAKPSVSNQFGIGNQTDVFVIGGDGSSRVSWVQGGGPWGGPLRF